MGIILIFIVAMVFFYDDYNYIIFVFNELYECSIVIWKRV